MELLVGKTPKERVGVRCDAALLDLIERTRRSHQRSEGEKPTRSVIMRKALRLGLQSLLEAERQETLFD